MYGVGDRDAPHAIDADQVHIYDQTCLEFLRHPKLEAPLRDCLANDIWGVTGGEPEGIKSHYWWKGSQWSQGWHTDGTALPGCLGRAARPPGSYCRQWPHTRSAPGPCAQSRI